MLSRLQALSTAAAPPRATQNRHKPTQNAFVYSVRNIKLWIIQCRTAFISAEESDGAFTFSTCAAGGIRFEVSQESNRYNAMCRGTPYSNNQLIFCFHNDGVVPRDMKNWPFAYVHTILTDMQMFYWTTTACLRKSSECYRRWKENTYSVYLALFGCHCT